MFDIVIYHVNYHSIMDGKFIQHVRELLSMDQAAFGDKVGLKENTIYKIETGRRNATPRFISFLKLRFPKQYANALEIWSKGRKNGKQRRKNR